MTQKQKPPQAFEDDVLTRMLAMAPDPKATPKPKKKAKKKIVKGA